MTREPIVEKTFGVSTLAGDETLGTLRRLCVHGHWGGQGRAWGQAEGRIRVVLWREPLGCPEEGAREGPGLLRGGWGPVQQEWVGSEVRVEMASSLPDSWEREE